MDLFTIDELLDLISHVIDLLVSFASSLKTPKEKSDKEKSESNNTDNT